MLAGVPEGKVHSKFVASIVAAALKVIGKGAHPPRADAVKLATGAAALTENPITNNKNITSTVTFCLLIIECIITATSFLLFVLL